LGVFYGCIALSLPLYRDHRGVAARDDDKGGCTVSSIEPHVRRVTPVVVLALIAGLGVSAASAATGHQSGAKVHRATAPCAESQALESLGRRSAAESAYLRELAIPGSVSCARRGLARLGQSGNSCAYAASLNAVGERQSAHAAYLRVLALDPSSRCAAGGAKQTIAPAATASVWAWFSDTAKNAGYAAALAVLAVLLVAILVLGMLELLTRIPWLRDQWPARNVRRPSLSVDDFQDEALPNRLGPGISGIVRGSVTWRSDRFGLNLVSGQAGIASALTGLGDVSGETKAAVAVIEFLMALLPRRRFVLKGQLQPAGAEGSGISLVLCQGGSARALVTFWAASVGVAGPAQAEGNPAVGGQAADPAAPTNAYRELAVAAAAWTDHWMVKLIGGEQLLTEDPLSWAYFRAGMESQRLGNPRRASVLYEQALAADGRNVGALANLGILCRRARRYEDAEMYLCRALPALAHPDRKQLSAEDNPDWYRTKYSLAALYSNWAADPEHQEGRDAHVQRAAELAAELARTTAARIDELRDARNSSNAERRFLKRTLLPFLEGTIEPSVLILAASTAADLAALGPGVAAAPPPVTTIVEPGRAELRAALAPVDPGSLIAFVERSPQRPPASLFNLACFYTRTGDYALAAERLLAAVREDLPAERRTMVQAAKNDPTLAPLLKRRPGIVPKLDRIAGIDTDPAEAGVRAEQIHQFDVQTRSHDALRADGWRIEWCTGDSPFDFVASRDGDWRLYEISCAAAVSADDIVSILGHVGLFRGRYADERQRARATLVLGPGFDLGPGVDQDNARAAGLDIEAELADTSLHPHLPVAA
jgi:tetratricopeptide (TPR) repeat protein